jgi:BlaI family transcriptional regulator, penicillinase repressor
MNELPRISESEWIVMKVIWANSPCTSGKIIELLEGHTKWKPKTVKSHISRLVQKKAIGFKDENRAYVYFPLVKEEECIKAESQSFLDRVFSGELNIAIANFIGDKKMSKQQIDDLRKMLDDKER